MKKGEDYRTRMSSEREKLVIIGGVCKKAKIQL